MIIKWVLPVIMGLFFKIPVANKTDENTVAVHLTNLRNDKGYVLVSLFDNSADFPRNAAKAIRKAKIKPEKGVASIVFKGLPKGRYAIAVLHDENNNLKMDTNLAGMPKEGFGFSNDAMGTFGPPSFEKAAANITGDSSLTIKIKYFL